MRDVRAGNDGVAWCGSGDDATAHANARLIAAAPELLDALKKAIDTTYSDKLKVEWIALVAKAAGEAA